MSWGADQYQEEDDPLYSGYNDPSSRIAPLATADPSQAFGAVPGSRWGGVPGTVMGGPGGAARPMTAIRGAGYTSQPQAIGTGMARKAFDPFNVASRGPPPPLKERSENGPEEKAKDLERKVNTLMEESTQAAASGNVQLALEKAKEATKAERILVKHRETNQIADAINNDLTYAVLFTLASMYHKSGMHTEALNTYTMIVKNKQYAMSGRLRVNMGNIYFEQKKYPNAIKMYRMALDQIPNTNRNVRFRIMRNIGVSFVRLGMFADAIASFEAIMDGLPDAKTGFNLVICYFAVGSAEAMKKGFAMLLGIPGYAELEDGDGLAGEDDQVHGRDALRQDIIERKRQTVQYLSTAARLIAGHIDRDIEAGYNWLVQLLRSSPFPEIGLELENEKAVAFFKARQFERATEILKGFVKTDTQLVATAATNLSFVYYVEGDITSAEKYARLAVDTEKYNARALVNLGNTFFIRGDWTTALQFYTDALSAEADCTEALFNQALAAKKLGNMDLALDSFMKMKRIMPSNTEVLFHIADIYEMQGDSREAVKWFSHAHTRAPTDAQLLARLGTACQRNGDDIQALQHFAEAYRLSPTSLEVIKWLGSQYATRGLFEKALSLFERASTIEPSNKAWWLTAASCMRKLGNPNGALAKLQQMLVKFPNDVDCLKGLVSVCNHLSKGELAVQYERQLRKAEEMAPPPGLQQVQQTESADYSRPVSATNRDTPTPPGGKYTPAPFVPITQALVPPSQQGPQRVVRAKEVADEQVFADTTLDDELLPM